ncbi:unnamed protein product [Rodentolepis nana]|uniref:BPTI/Kunitz inhibitor domain-containing protein n=1 Tax=Rodentolepis nana TaxID=102285 RepID=A0A0R3TP99_RODNA|nr:unnamed protein product [Rodentolepis nana]
MANYLAFTFSSAISATFMHPACAEPRDPGPCRGYTLAYHYDPSSNSCQPFHYGGCGGNRNRFYSYLTCTYLCKRNEIPWILKKVADGEGSYEDWQRWRKKLRL